MHTCTSGSDGLKSSGNSGFTRVILKMVSRQEGSAWVSRLLGKVVELVSGYALIKESGFRI